MGTKASAGRVTHKCSESLQQRRELHQGCGTPTPAAKPPFQSQLGHFQEKDSLGGAALPLQTLLNHGKAK